jgi:hypothetical protein
MDIILKQQYQAGRMCRERHWSGTTVCGVLCCLVWLSQALREGSVLTVTAQHVTHTYNSTYWARSKQNKDGKERIKAIQTAEQLKAVTLSRAGKDLNVSRGLME